MSVNRYWKVLKNWVQQIEGRVEGATICTVPPDSLITFVPGHIRHNPKGLGEIVCARLPIGGMAYAAVGLGEILRSGNLEELFEQVRANNHAIANRLVVHSGITEFDGAVTLRLFPQTAFSATTYTCMVTCHGATDIRAGA